MSGFDPTRFIGDTSPRVASDGGSWAPPPEPHKPPETHDVWRDERPSVAAVAAVAELTGDKPFATDLNRLFCQPAPLRFSERRWVKLLRGVHRFADLYASDALAAGWEPIELFGVHRAWFTHNSMPALACATGIGITVRGREVIEISSSALTIRERSGHTSRCYHAHHMSARGEAVLIWEAPLD